MALTDAEYILKRLQLESYETEATRLLCLAADLRMELAQAEAEKGIDKKAAK